MGMVSPRFPWQRHIVVSNAATTQREMQTVNELDGVCLVVKIISSAMGGTVDSLVLYSHTIHSAPGGEQYLSKESHSVQLILKSIYTL